MNQNNFCTESKELFKVEYTHDISDESDVWTQFSHMHIYMMIAIHQ